MYVTQQRSQRMKKSCRIGTHIAGWLADWRAHSYCSARTHRPNKATRIFVCILLLYIYIYNIRVYNSIIYTIYITNNNDDNNNNNKTSELFTRWKQMLYSQRYYNNNVYTYSIGRLATTKNNIYVYAAHIRSLWPIRVRPRPRLCEMNYCVYFILILKCYFRRLGLR